MVAASESGRFRRRERSSPEGGVWTALPTSLSGNPAAGRVRGSGTPLAFSASRDGSLGLSKRHLHTGSCAVTKITQFSSATASSARSESNQPALAPTAGGDRSIYGLHLKVLLSLRFDEINQLISHMASGLSPSTPIRFAKIWPLAR